MGRGGTLTLILTVDRYINELTFLGKPLTVNINVNVPPIRKGEGEGETEGVNQDEPIVFFRMAMKKD